jgi:hypothetical protein
MPNPSLELAIGMAIILLGLSFAYKTYQASILGKCTYWTGFLPLTVISPWITHLPASSKRSLTKTAQGLWVHMVMGPIFLVCSVLCFAAGAELMGLPGISTLNYILVGGNSGRAAAVAFNKHTGYRFPFLERSGETLGKRIDKAQMGIKADDEMLPNAPPKSIKSQMEDAHNEKY